MRWNGNYLDESSPFHVAIQCDSIDPFILLLTDWNLVNWSRPSALEIQKPETAIWFFKIQLKKKSIVNRGGLLLSSE